MSEITTPWKLAEKALKKKSKTTRLQAVPSFCGPGPRSGGGSVPQSARAEPLRLRGLFKLWTGPGAFTQ